MCFSHDHPRICYAWMGAFLVANLTEYTDIVCGVVNVMVLFSTECKKLWYGEIVVANFGLVRQIFFYLFSLRVHLPELTRRTYV